MGVNIGEPDYKTYPPLSVDISVLEESANKRYIVIPFEEQDLDDELTNEMLEMVAGGVANNML